MLDADKNSDDLSKVSMQATEKKNNIENKLPNPSLNIEDKHLIAENHYLIPKDAPAGWKKPLLSVPNISMDVSTRFPVKVDNENASAAKYDSMQVKEQEICPTVQMKVNEKSKPAIRGDINDISAIIQNKLNNDKSFQCYPESEYYTPNGSMNDVRIAEPYEYEETVGKWTSIFESKAKNSAKDGIIMPDAGKVHESNGNEVRENIGSKSADSHKEDHMRDTLTNDISLTTIVSGLREIVVNAEKTMRIR